MALRKTVDMPMRELPHRILIAVLRVIGAVSQQQPNHFEVMKGT
eukprot:CAMPEP_0184359854 /NCGR_PEP_ID=MMETSP1089-20130417/122120_1 /TAXON_ID=38269 ORGANISM="Gloeochaete wittrockiana, Strain SAG46.84" /NCGR_SAMPLE_ID=MMETSP1089 /ASSEMBLY_ACC=CAM_ASM_000445 /LENGTH=43 /DNA_ID= /DNA_START= /DNA_END= /DNA_ORIENTATION=